MADILINDDRLVRGKLSFIRGVDITKSQPVVTISGQLATHRYFDEIVKIETERYILSDVTVTQESFGSDDFNIIYTFFADNLEIRNGESPYSDIEIEQKELELYGGDNDGGK